MTREPQYEFKSIRVGIKWLCFLLAFLSAVPALADDSLVLNDVPTYYWYYGCSPTSGMMVWGYWDIYGYSNLIPGSNSWVNISNAIASEGHILGSTHSDDCLADFMGTSPGGSTPSGNIAPGMSDYASWRGYSFDAKPIASNVDLWETFVHEIEFGRPVLINVSAEHNGEIGGHTVAAIGFKTVNGVNYYGFRSTWVDESHQPGWDAETGIMWKEFKSNSTPGDWGLDDSEPMDTVRPSGTWDTAWNVATGYWNDTRNWGNGLPTYDAFTYIPQGNTAIVTGTANYTRFLNNTGYLQIAGGTLTGGQIRNAGTIIGNGTVSADIHNFGQIVENSGTLTLIGNGSSTDGVFATQDSSQIRIWAPTAFTLHGDNSVVGNGSLEIAQGTVHATDNETTTLIGGGNILIQRRKLVG